MYIPNGYDATVKDNSAFISLYDHEKGKYRTISATWFTASCAAQALIGDMAIILTSSEKPNNGGMHQDYL